MPRKKAVPVAANPTVLTRGNRIALALIEVLGLGIAVYLTLIAFHVIYDGQVPCLRSKIFACESVVRGPFSKIGFFSISISIALMGVFYFMSQLALTAALGWRRWVAPLKAASVFGGLLFVAWLRALELVHMKKICPWCWGVALTVVLQTALVWPLLTTLLPPMRFHARLAGAGLFLFAFLGMTTATEEIFKPSRRGTVYFFGHKPAMEDEEDPDEEVQEVQVAAEKTLAPASASAAERKPAAAPSPTSHPKMPRSEKKPAVEVAEAQPTPKPPLVRRTPEPVAATPAAVASTPVPTPTPAPAPQTQAFAEPEPPIELPEVPELQILQQRGWRMVASTERVEQLIRAQGPVLLMVYDPFCEECHATMRKGLNADEVDQLPVTRVAIDQSSLTGKISAAVTHVPTLLLIDREGHVLFNHTGRIASRKLVQEVSARL